MNKKAEELHPLGIIVAGIVLLLVAFIVLSILSGKTRQSETYFNQPLHDAAELSCKTRGLRQQVEQTLVDVDNDIRPDTLCDVCVCSPVCPNGESSNNDRDENQNHVPDGCEDPDPQDKEDPWWPGCKRAERVNAFEGKKEKNIVILNKEEKLWQCRPAGEASRTQSTVEKI